MEPATAAAAVAATAEDDDGGKVENSVPESASPARSVVRVSIERLDDLFNLVGEMVNNRSFFKQRLSELEQQIEELHHTTRRLRVSSGKLETDFESGDAGGGSSSSSSGPASISLGGANYGIRPGQANSVANFKAQEFDTLEFDRYTDFHQTARELVETASDASSINNNLDNLLDNLNLLFENQHRLLEGMQDNLLRLRMVSLDSLAQRLHRTARVTAQEEGKCVDLTIENDTIEIDTEILDSFVEPLLHILRNAVAHGIEPAETRRLLGKPEKGRITLRAYSEGTHIVFVLSDDGRGISLADLKEKAAQIGFISKQEAAAMSDEEAYSLIFLPGLSTAAQISQVSGRGVGMNIVKTNITRRQGTISVKSEPGKGTTFTVRLPVALAVTRALLVKAAGTETFAFPLNLVKQVTEISPAEFEQAKRDKRLLVGKTAYSFFHFNELLNLPTVMPAAGNDSKIPLLLLETSENPSAMAIDQILRTEEIVIKPLGATLENVPEIIGATILGDGCAVPVLDLVYLLKKPAVHVKKPVRNLPEKKSGLTVLIVDDSPSVRQINLKLIKNAGWQAIIAKDGLEALEILQTLGETPDIVLTDVEMPRMDGYELLASLKRQPSTNSIPVIMITSRAGEKHRRKAFDLGVDEYLTKPYQDGMLIETIKRLTIHPPA
jgi:chemosensory pili system protein ChpA (sensor histidine kinase/response regulator)